MRLLIVEMERMFAESLATFLGGQDEIEVVGTALSLSQAVNIASVIRLDIVTTSYRLPDGDGIELIGQLKSRLPDVKIIMVSAFERKDVVFTAMAAGCSGFVSKGRPLSDVVVAARAVMRDETVLPRTLLGRLVEDLIDTEEWHGTNLTPTEDAILRLFPEGLPDHAIADRLGLTERSVRNQVQSILPKLGSHSKLQALATAVRRGIIIL
jgi:DNA-binding NarL/FixJ family response regulator